MFPLPYNRFHFLSNGIPFNMNEHLIDEIKYLLKLDISQNHSKLNRDLSSFNKKCTILTTEEIYLLVSIFNPDQVSKIKSLIDERDEDNENQIFQLNIPIPINVRIKYDKFDQYTICFADNLPFTADQIYSQVIECALPQIKSTPSIFATFSKTDPLSLDITNKIQKDNEDAIFVFIPDENTLEEDYLTTYIEVLLPDIDNDNFNNIKEKLHNIYDNVKLSICKKCDLYFSPAANENCYTYFHKGKQIPFEGGHMEEIVVNDENDDNPEIMVNYSCCGECLKGEVPFCCGKKDNGKHEINKNKKVSSFSITKTNPGKLHFPHK